ncbi:hypothetical protein ACXXNA_05785 [Bordetella bronchiseptica]
MVESNKLPIRYPEFAQRVKAAMSSRGLEVQDVVDGFKARGVRITYEMVRRYTLGQAMPRQDKMAILAATLHVTPSDLQYGVDGMANAGSTSPIPAPTLSPEEEASVLWRRYTAADEASRVTVDFLLSGRKSRPTWMSPAVAGMLATAISLVAEQFPSSITPGSRPTGTHGR